MVDKNELLNTKAIDKPLQPNEITAIQLATMQQILSLQMEGLTGREKVGDKLTFDLKKVFTPADGKPLLVLKQTNDEIVPEVETKSVCSLGKRKHDQDQTQVKEKDDVMNAGKQDVVTASKKKKNRQRRGKLSSKLVDILVKKREISRNIIPCYLNLHCIMEQKSFKGQVHKTSCIMKNEEMDINDIEKKDVNWIVAINGTQSKKLIFETSQLVEAHEVTILGQEFATNIFEIGENSNTKGYIKIQKKQKTYNKNKSPSSPYCSFIKNEQQTRNKICNVIAQGKGTIEDVKICCVCQTQIQADDFLDKIFKDYKKRFLYLHSNNKSICINCMQYFLQIKREQERQNILLTYYLQTLSSVDREWDYSSSIKIDNNSIIRKLLSNTICDDKLYILLNKNIGIHVMKINPCLEKKQYNKLKVELKGARFPPDADMSGIKGKVVSKPVDGKIGLILFEGTNNFITLGNSDIDHKDGISLSKQESISIGRLELGNRAGAAGGMVYPTTNSHSLSKVTKKRNSFLLANKKSSGLTCHYQNDSNVVKSYNGVYNDILMRKLNTNQKTKHMLEYEYLRSITIQEMLKRFQIFIIVYQFNLYKDMTKNPFELLNNILEGKKKKNLYMTFVAMNYSHVESSLLVWSCSTGESRNHIALAAHVDANTCNEIESLLLFGRIPYNTSKPIHQLLDEYVNGELYFPCHGLDITYECVNDITHCNLKEIIHLPDESRDIYNWSRVHGPP